MKQLCVALIAFCFLVAPATAAHIYVVGNYDWNVISQPTIDIPVYISGGETMDAAGIALSVGDGGSMLGGTETIYFSGIDFTTGTVWAGKPIVSTDMYPGNAGVDMGNVYISTTATTTAYGKLMTFTLHAPTGGLAGRVGEQLLLDPYAGGASDVGLDGNTLNPTYGTGTLTLTPEPSTMALLVCGLLAYLCYAWRKRR